jgi:hypothetical protein
MQEYKKGNFIFIKDKVKQDFINNKIMENKEFEGSRPFFFAIKDSKIDDIFWLIPISSKLQKYERIYNNKIENNGFCDTLHFADVKGQRRAFLLQNMIPLTSNYFENVYKENNGVPVAIDNRDSKEIITKCQKIIALAENRNIDLTFTNIKDMKNKLVQSLKNSIEVVDNFGIKELETTQKNIDKELSSTLSKNKNNVVR